MCIANIVSWNVSQVVYRNTNRIVTKCIVTPLNVIIVLREVCLRNPDWGFIYIPNVVFIFIDGMRCVYLKTDVSTLDVLLRMSSWCIFRGKTGFLDCISWLFREAAQRSLMSLLCSLLVAGTLWFRFKVSRSSSISRVWDWKRVNCQNICRPIGHVLRTRSYIKKASLLLLLSWWRSWMRE